MLSDDLVVISLDSGGCWAMSTPFRGASFGWPVVPVRAPLGGLFHLAKADRHEVTPLPRSEAVAQLVACLPFVPDEPAYYGRALELCAVVVEQVPVCTLRFTPDPGFWRKVLHGHSA